MLHGGPNAGHSRYIHRRQRRPGRGRLIPPQHPVGFGLDQLPFGTALGQIKNYFLHKNREHRLAIEQHQLVPRTGHCHVKQAAVLLVLAGVLGGAAADLRLGGQHAVKGIQQHHPVILQTLAGMDRR